MSMFQKVFGTHSEREVKRIKPLVDQIEALRPTMQALSDEDLRNKTTEFKERLSKGETLDDLLPDIMNRVHATPQHRRRSPWLRAVMGMAACLVVVLGIYLVRQQAEKGGDSPFSGILPDSSANNSVGADEDTFTDEVTPSDGGLTFASGGTERQEPSDPADYVLIDCPELAQQARQWLSQQGLEPDEDGVYPLTAQQVQDLNAAVPELELPTDDALRLLLED